MKFIAFLIPFVVAFANATRGSLPDYVVPCKADDDDCLRYTVKKLVPHLIEGVPEFKLQSIDPLSIPDHKQDDLTSPDMPYVGNFVNILYIGASNFEVYKFTVDLNKLELNLVVFFPKLVMSAHEIVRVNALGYYLDGEWPTKETYENVTINFSLVGTRYSSEGQQHINWREGQIKTSFDEGSYDVDTSYEGGQDYQAFLNKASGEYPNVFDPEVELYIKETIGNFILDSLNVVHELFPVDVMYQSD